MKWRRKKKKGNGKTNRTTKWRNGIGVFWGITIQQEKGGEREKEKKEDGLTGKERKKR